MGTISTGVGLISGLNTKDIIDQLMSIESRPKTLLQTRIDSLNQQRLAFTDLTTRLASLKITATTLKKPSSFQNTTATSSNSNVLTATTTKNAPVGSFQFQVSRLVTTQQAITSGFSDYASAKVGAGTFTIEMGGGDLGSQTQLSQLNGGEGVRRGQFRITDRSGATTVIDTSNAISLDDVVKKINNSLDISVHAKIDQNRLVLTDLTNKTAADLTVQDLGGGHAAEDLGITNATAASVTASTLGGQDINYLSNNNLLSDLNDGRGVRRATSGTDFDITVGSTVHHVSLSSAKTLGDVISTLNKISGTDPADFTATLNGNAIQINAVNPADSITVTEVGSKAATDLGILKTGTGQINGSDVLAGIDTVLLSSLNGGQGLSLGSITLADRTNNGGNGPATIDLSGAHTVQDILDAINSAPNAKVAASLNASGNGIQIVDRSGGTGNLIIDDASGTTAASLGIKGTFDSSKTIVSGANLQRQWVTENTLLKDYNGGKGVTPGSFRITSASGNSALIDLSQSNYTNLKDVITAINSANTGVVASINAHGDGLLLTDNSGGAGTMKVESVSGTTASDLNLLGTVSGNTLDGSFEKTLDITADDTLASVQQKINNLGFGISASIINDGSGSAPYRLSLNARNSGYHGRVVLDAGSTSLQSHNLVEAQDAAVFLGGADAEKPLLVTASSNQLSGVIPGVNIELNGVSSSPVTLSITRNADSVSKQLQDFADNFNQMVDKISTLTSFDSSTNKAGLLLGDSTIQQIQSQLYGAFTSVVSSVGRYRTFADIGLTIGDSAKLTFDPDKFQTAYATDPDSVSALFTKSQTIDGNLQELGLGSKLESAITKLIDPVGGLITLTDQTIDSRTTQFQGRITQLDSLLQDKRTRLEQQFANMETILSNLQSQQSALGSLSTTTTSSSSK